jgi:hypothetical protein
MVLLLMIAAMKATDPNRAVACHQERVQLRDIASEV